MEGRRAGSAPEHPTPALRQEVWGAWQCQHWLGQCGVVLVPTARLAGSSQPAAARLSSVTCTATAWHERGRAGPLLQPGKEQHSMAQRGMAQLPSPGSSSHRLGTGNPGVRAKGPFLLVEQHPWLWAAHSVWCPQGKGKSSSKDRGSPTGSSEGRAPEVGSCPAWLLHWQVGKGRGAGSFPRATPGLVVLWALPRGIVAASAGP